VGGGGRELGECRATVAEEEEASPASGTVPTRGKRRRSPHPLEDRRRSVKRGGGPDKGDWDGEATGREVAADMTAVR
jgi:hypothetical protein